MKLGFVSSILEGASFQEVVDTAAELGYECVEAACWPKGRAERRYAGVTHIDAESLDEAKCASILDECRKKNVEISSLAYYPNTMDPDPEKRKVIIEHLKCLIRTAPKLGVHMVTTFVGRVQDKTVEENLEIFKRVWPPIIKYAEDCGVKVAIENCPMLFTKEQWPAGQNLATTPAIWRKLFSIIPSENFGINYDPSHFVWQHIDYLKPIYEFHNRIFHVHFKDIKLLKDKEAEVGIMAYPLEFMRPKLPGLGDVDWGKFVSALTDIGYDGYACIEVEDKAFEGSPEKIKKSLEISYRYMRQFVI